MSAGLLNKGDLTQDLSPLESLVDSSGAIISFDHI